MQEQIDVNAPGIAEGGDEEINPRALTADRHVQRAEVDLQLLPWCCLKAHRCEPLRQRLATQMPDGSLDGAKAYIDPQLALQILPTHIGVASMPQVSAGKPLAQLCQAASPLRRSVGLADDNYLDRLTTTIFGRLSATAGCAVNDGVRRLSGRKDQERTMPGQRTTDRQVKRYKELRRTLTQEAAAAKTGISVRTARRIEHMAALPSQRPMRSWRTRNDPLAAVWDEEIVPLLRRAPGLTAVTIFEELERQHPGRLPAGVLRTLQRRIRTWRALEGEEREVYFAQAHDPGRQGLSDFTDANELAVTLDGVRFDHRLYQFALAYSGWRHVEVILGGESWVALSTGLQNALWALGGVPAEHRTDSLSAAFNNLAEREELTARYEALCERYGMRATRNNLGVSHENGSIEARQGTIKRSIEQALLLRGTRDFTTLLDCRHFVAEVAMRLNARTSKALTIERACLQPLPCEALE